MSQFAVMAVFIVAVGGVVAAYASHQQRKYAALAAAEREAADHSGS